MTWWTLEPRDPLIVRDGRPFGAEDDDHAASLPFPPPSVTAGALRTRIGFAARRPNQSAFGLTPDQARAIQVQGPVLATLHPTDAPSLLLARPLDGVAFDTAGTPERWRVHRLSPSERWADGASSLPPGLQPVSPVADFPTEKPSRSAPTFWRSDILRAWLDAPPKALDLDQASTHPELPHERRVHLKINPETRTGEDGMLFSTDGLRFATPGRRALLVRCDDDRLQPGLVPLGGERRMSLLRRAQCEPTWGPPTLPSLQARVVLLTPALFKEGSIPTSIAGARVVAACVGRPQTISGWDLAARGPKPTRRMAPAGSVYWVELESGTDPASWAQRVHWQAVSDQQQDCLDGFGLAVVGVWA